MSEYDVGHLKSTTHHQLDIVWEIPKFLSLKENNCYDSPPSSFGDTSWKIRVYPNGGHGFISVFVFRGDSGPPMTATVDLFLKMKEEKRRVGSEQRWTFDGNSFGDWNVLKRSLLVARPTVFLPSGTLTILCCLQFDEGEVVKVHEAFLQAEAYPDFESKALTAAVQGIKVLRDYKGLLRSEENCDVTLEVGGQTFQAHRVILGARSSVFASMLRHNMKEKNTGLISIADCDKDIFEDFLHFLYCGSVENLSSQNVFSLYRTSDKYDVQDLKCKCLRYIKSHIKVHNICDVLTLSLQHEETDLYKHASDFFAKNLAEIIVTEKWKVFLAENPSQSNELLIKAIIPQKSSSTAFI